MIARNSSNDIDGLAELKAKLDALPAKIEVAEMQSVYGVIDGLPDLSVVMNLAEIDDLKYLSDAVDGLLERERGEAIDGVPS